MGVNKILTFFYFLNLILGLESSSNILPTSTTPLPPLSQHSIESSSTQNGFHKLDDTSQPLHRHYSINRAVNDEEFVEQPPQHNLVVSYEKINSIVDIINDNDNEDENKQSSELLTNQKLLFKINFKLLFVRF